MSLEPLCDPRRSTPTQAKPLHRLGLSHPELSDGGEALAQRIVHLDRVEAPRLRRLWEYYRNRATPHSNAGQPSAKPYRQAQEYGLPPRILGGTFDGDLVERKEVVIENDIAWRIDAMVDFLFGQSIVISSTVADDRRRERIDRLVRAIFGTNGGIAFLQKLALLGAVYGHVDVLVKYVGPTRGNGVASEAAAPQPACDGQQLGERGTTPATSEDEVASDAALASMIRFEIVEPTRAVPILCPVNPGVAVAYAQHYRVRRARADRVRERQSSWLDAINPFKPRTTVSNRNTVDVPVLEMIGPHRWQRYEGDALVAEGDNSLGRLPLVHVQNTAVPFEYAGNSDVEPLMPLQDELNTRLSDRAHRISLQSFKTYLVKGLENGTEVVPSIGKVYATDNLDASVETFGGDDACPSEQGHIDEIREALDKTSGVSPIAAGAIKGRIGRLSSAAALRVTLLALLGRTERKRTTYGPAIAQLVELALAWLDRAGHFATAPAERRVNVYWPNPIPANEAEQIDTARGKRELGVDPAQVARELGY